MSEYETMDTLVPGIGPGFGRARHSKPCRRTGAVLEQLFRGGGSVLRRAMLGGGGA